MIKAIEVEGVGTVRPLNSWQLERIKTIGDRRNKTIAFIAFGFGMTVPQFKTLSAAKQEECRQAANALSSPANF